MLPHLPPSDTLRHRIRGFAFILDFCGDKGVTADIERIRIQQINEAYERLQKGDVKYRFVIDMASL